MKNVTIKLRALLIIMSLLLAVTPMTVLSETEEINYVSIGDSLAASILHNGSVGVGYVGEIARGLEARGYQVNVYNKAVPGATTRDVLRNQLGAPELADADIITLSAGPNDFRALLDIASLERFDPLYLDSEAIEEMKQEAQTTAINSMLTLKLSQRLYLLY